MIVLQQNTLIFYLPPPDIVPTVQPAAIPTTDLNQLDRGLQYQHTPTYLGPTLGWRDLSVLPSRLVTGNFTIQPGDATLIVSFGGYITLPDVSLWVRSPHYAPFNPFTRGLWIKDITGTPGITILPFDDQTIDGQDTATMTTAYQITRLYPLIELTGWYIG